MKSITFIVPCLNKNSDSPQYVLLLSVQLQSLWVPDSGDVPRRVDAATPMYCCLASGACTTTISGFPIDPQSTSNLIWHCGSDEGGYSDNPVYNQSLASVNQSSVHAAWTVCSVGHTGPLCGSCVPGYYKSSHFEPCVRCEDGMWGVVLGVLSGLCTYHWHNNVPFIPPLIL